VQIALGATRARLDGLGAAIVDGVGFPQLAVSTVTTVAAAYLLLGWRGIGCTALLAAFTLVARWWFHRRLGGITGDVIGCVSELNEILCLLILIALSGKGWGS
jgi:adenosylcobinamide-GDP ribazoletransferase